MAPKLYSAPARNPADMCALIEKHRVTHLKVVPSLLIRLLNDPAVSQHDLSSLQIIQSGGQRLQPEVRRLAKKLIPECLCAGKFRDVRRAAHVRSRSTIPKMYGWKPWVGLCLADDEVKILDDDDNEVPFGEVGELCCRGPYTLRGYYGVPEYNARAFTPDGFYRSGDLMRQHPSGNYMVEGRKERSYQSRWGKN